MLKAVSSISNAIGALNYKGTWNATTNTPALASGVGTKGDYYVVSVAGTTTLDGISNWGIGDWAVFNGSAWQRVEGGADLNGVNLSVSGTSTLSGLTASTALALNSQKEVVSVANTGSGNNVLATSPSIATPTLTGDVQISTGNLVVGTAGKGIDFSATPQAPGALSELLADYERGSWTPNVGGNATYYVQEGYYIKVGELVYIWGKIVINVLGTGSTQILSGLPFTSVSSIFATTHSVPVNYFNSLAVQAVDIIGQIGGNTTGMIFNINRTPVNTTQDYVAALFGDLARIEFSGCYQSAS